jgi:hypothetical protein
MSAYWGWVRYGKSWKVAVTGTTLAEALRHLLDWIRGKPKPPLASCVRPAGVHPAQGGAGGHASGTGGPDPPGAARTLRQRGNATGRGKG